MKKLLLGFTLISSFSVFAGLDMEKVYLDDSIPYEKYEMTLTAKKLIENTMANTTKIFAPAIEVKSGENIFEIRILSDGITSDRVLCEKFGFENGQADAAEREFSDGEKYVRITDGKIGTSNSIYSDALVTEIECKN